MHALKLHYLDLSDLDRSDFNLVELDLEQIEIQQPDAVRLQAFALTLAAQPASPKIHKLADQAYKALATFQQELFVKPLDGFPLLSELAEQMDACLRAWRALGQIYARCSVAGGTSDLVGAIACLRQIIVLCGFYHRELPYGAWLDLHHLFRLAQKTGLAQSRCTWQGKRVSPEGEYLRALLLGLADPYGLLPQEVYLLDCLLEKWAPLAKLNSAGEGWCLDEAEGAPAKWRMAMPGQDLRLDLTGLARMFAENRHLASASGRFASQSRADTVTADFLEYLEKRWFYPQSELCEFALGSGEWVIGLKSIFARLNGEEVAAIAARTPIDPPPQAIQIGDLVGVFAPGGEMHGLAVVVKIKWSKALEMQLEAVPGTVWPVGIQPLYRAKQPCAYQRGLLLAESRKLFLLLAEQPLGESTLVRLLYQDKQYPVRLDSCHSLARGVLRCQCVSIANWLQK